MTISEQIKVLCVRCNMSEAELARRLGKSPQSFNAKMKRESFTIDDLNKIADVVGVFCVRGIKMPIKNVENEFASKDMKKIYRNMLFSAQNKQRRSNTMADTFLA